MYVRWQSRKRRTAEFGFGKSDVHWAAVIVENIRVNGKPTQRHVAYLAGFTESAVAIPAQQRFLWERIETRFDRLGNRISPDDRRRIKAALSEKIGKPPTKKRRKQLDRKREQTLAKLSESIRQR
jgi:hypothetical protein